MSSNFVRFQEILNQAFAENFTCLTQKLVNPLKNLSLHFLIGIPFIEISPFIWRLPSKFQINWETAYLINLNFMTITENDMPGAKFWEDLAKLYLL